MRSVFRSVLIALLAILALGAVAASGASAHEYFIEGKSMSELGIKEEAFTSKATTNVVLSATGEDVQITCAKGKGKGTLDQGGTGLATFELAECSMQKPSATCQIHEPVILENFADDLVEFEGKLSNEFSPIFSILKFTNCPLEEVQLGGQLTGKVKSEADKETQEVVFSLTSGSELEFGGGKASMKFTDTSQLSGANSGKKWSARK